MKKNESILTDILKQYQVAILEIVGDEFAPKKARGSPERKRLLGLTAHTVPLLLIAEQEVKALLFGIIGEDEQLLEKDGLEYLTPIQAAQNDIRAKLRKKVEEL